MAVDYDAWSDVENRALEENTARCFEELSKGRVIRLSSLFPELGLTSDDNYTMWHPPTSPKAKQSDPAANLGNLLAHYGKILMPIDYFMNRQDFQNHCMMSVKDLIECLKANPINYVPFIAAAAEHYRAVGFYDELFETCHRLYGHYPPFMTLRCNALRDTLHTLTRFVQEEGAIPERPEALLERFPESDIKWVLDKEVDRIVGAEDLRQLSNKVSLRPELAKNVLATLIVSLRVNGHDDLVKFLLNDFHKASGNILLLHEILYQYRTYLVQPASEGLGGFENYTTNDLENMAFLRILPLKANELKDLDIANMRLLCNSPSARSAVNLGSYNMQVFVRGGDDVNTLNELAKFGERHKKELKRMADYKEYVSRGRLNDAAKALAKSGQVYGQIGEELADLARKEERAKIATWFMTGGATILSDMAVVLQQGLPSDWRLVVMLFKDLLASRIKDIDPKLIVEWMYDIRQWPWYEKGIPYLYWKESQ